MGDVYLGKVLPERSMNSAAAMPDDKAEKDKKLKKACADFDSYFIYYMLKTMRNTIPKGGIFSNFNGKDTYEMMMDQKVADELAKSGGIGVNKLLYDQLKRIE